MAKNWFLLTLLSLPFLTGAAQAVYLWMKQSREDPDWKAIFNCSIGWRSHSDQAVGKVESFFSDFDSDITKASRMAALSVAAYPANENARVELGRECARVGMTFSFWSFESASGVILFEPETKRLYIGIAGTDEKEDAIYDVMTYPEQLSKWSRLHRISVSEDSISLATTAGFATYAMLCHRGIFQGLNRMGVKLSDVSSVTLTGHSLGGAAVSVLQHTKPFERALGITFGSPKAWRLFGYVPERSSIRVRKIFDPVPYLPPLICKHPHRKQIVISFKNRYSSHVPKSFWLPVIAISIVYWSAGLFINFLNFVFKTKLRMGIQRSHSMISSFMELKAQW